MATIRLEDHSGRGGGIENPENDDHHHVREHDSCAKVKEIHGEDCTCAMASEAEQNYVGAIRSLIEMLEDSKCDQLRVRIKNAALERSLDLLAEICSAQAAALEARGIDTTMTLLDNTAKLD